MHLRHPTLTLALVALGVIATPFPAGAICLVVDDSGTPAPAVLPDQSILFVTRASVEIPSTCAPSEPDVGPTIDTDLGDTDPLDTDPADTDRTDTDLAQSVVDTDAADTDPKPEPEPGCEAHTGDTVTMVVQPRFATSPDGARFALIMATPSRPWVTLQDPLVFEDLERVTAHRVVYDTTYVEDPALGQQCSDPDYHAAMAADQAQYGSGSSGGCGGWGAPSPSDIGLTGAADTAPENEDSDATYDSDLSIDDTGVEVVSIGEYEIAVLARSDIASVAAWLGEHGYAHDEGALDPLRPYVAMGWSVVAVRVVVPGSAMGALAPIGFSWEGSTVRVPVAIAGARAAGASTLDAYVLSDRIAWGFPQGTLRWVDRVNVDGGHAMNLSRTTLSVPALAAPEDDPIAVSFGGDYLPVHDEEVVPRTVSVPVSDCSAQVAASTPDPVSSPSKRGWCGCASAGPGALAGPGVLALAVALRRRRRAAGR